jgi:Domain of unknown function (DUF4258)
LDFVKEPLSNADAKKLIRAILGDGDVSFTSHARKEMAADRLTAVDVNNILRGGWVEYSELIEGTWRYRVRTNIMFTVVAFRSEDNLVVVTAWRKRTGGVE